MSLFVVFFELIFFKLVFYCLECLNYPEIFIYNFIVIFANFVNQICCFKFEYFFKNYLYSINCNIYSKKNQNRNCNIVAFFPIAIAYTTCIHSATYFLQHHFQANHFVSSLVDSLAFNQTKTFLSVVGNNFHHVW